MEHLGQSITQQLRPATMRDLVIWLEPDDLKEIAQLKWLGYTAPGFLSLFVNKGDPTEWQAHWWSQVGARSSLTACRESIKMFFKEAGADYIVGLTPCDNQKGLKMAKLLGFTPHGFMRDSNGKLSLLTSKEKNNG